MSKWLRREAALASKVYQEIIAEAIADLGNFGFFHKDDILEAADYTTVGDTIRWDYVAEEIKARLHTELVPLGSSFFTRHRHDEEVLNPGKFIAGGHGKKTAGYAAVIPENDHLVIHRVHQRAAQIEGSAEALIKNVNVIDEQRKKSGLTPITRPVIKKLAQS